VRPIGGQGHPRENKWNEQLMSHQKTIRKRNEETVGGCRERV